MVATKQRIGEILVRHDSITRQRLSEALSEQEGRGPRLGELLVRKGWVSQETVAEALAEQLSLPYAEPPLRPSPEAAELLPVDVIRGRAVLPLESSSRSVRLAMADPLDFQLVDDLRFRLGRRIDPVVASSLAIADAASQLSEDDLSDLLRQLPRRLTRSHEPDGSLLEEVARSAPVVRLVDHLLEQAVAARASDIHLEAEDEALRVRTRVDGILRTALELPQTVHAAVVSRVKVMAGMDISVKRRPQDGGFRLRQGDANLSVRVSTLPTEGGEKAVLRILDPTNAPGDLESLGLSPRDLAAVRGLLRSGQGVVLAAGPTGSGKSSTLYGALAELDVAGLNVITLEDPIEYRVMGVNQVQVQPRAGLTFPFALRSVLRQDPDVVMVGEIRDRETAEIAMTAALTGHLVLSTIHTIDAPSAITRLLNMGVPPFLVAGGLSGVVAQRLVRTLCPHCRNREPTCPECSDGYRGRTGVFQVLVMTDPLRDEIIRRASTVELRRLASRGGMRTMAEDARRKVAEGTTGPAEAARVLRTDPDGLLPCDTCGSSIPTSALGCPQCGRRRIHQCACGQEVRSFWRFCPWCLRTLTRL